MWWWIATVAALAMSVLWIAYVSAEVGRGKWKALSFGIVPAYAWHAGFGLLGLAALMKTVG